MRARSTLDWSQSKLFFVRIQGHSKSSILAFLRSSSPVLVIISIMSVPICNHFHVKRANSGRITPFKGCPSFFPRSWKLPLSSDVKFCHKILETVSYHTVKTRSLYLTWSSNGTRLWQTDGQTERQTELLQLLRAIMLALALKNPPKTRPYRASPACRISSHSVSCHLTQVNTPRFNPSQTGRYSIYLPWRDGRLSWLLCWSYTYLDGLPLCRRSHYDPRSNRVFTV